MAGNKLGISPKVSGSTILEVIVAMIIIIVVFDLGMMIYANVSRLSVSARQIKAQAVLKNVLLRSEQAKQYSSQSLTMDGFRIEIAMLPYGADTVLEQLQLIAFDDNQKKIAEVNKLVIR